MSCLPPAAQRLLRSVSLDALRGFEAAARHGSLTAAAEEMSLTQGALSKQVKQLEDAVGRPLFVRGPRGLELTPAGQGLHDAVREALLGLGAALARAAQLQRRSVAVSVPPSCASLWLVPRLSDYRQRYPEIDVHVDASEDNLVLEREGIDLAVRLGPPGRVPSHWSPLARERLVLVAAPPLARQVQRPADLAKHALLAFHHPIQRQPWMAWSDWYALLGLVLHPDQPVFRFSQYEHLVKAACDGVGVAIGRLPQLLPMLRGGQLQVVLPAHRADGAVHHLVVSERAVGRQEVQAFVQWLHASLADDLGSIEALASAPA